MIDNDKDSEDNQEFNITTKLEEIENVNSSKVEDSNKKEKKETFNYQKIKNEIRKLNQQQKKNNSGL